MSIEKLIAENTAALRELTAALLKHPVQQDLPLAELRTELRTETQAVLQEAKAETKAGKSKTTAPASSAPAPAVEETAPAAPATEQAASDIDLPKVVEVTLALGKAGKRAQLVELLEGYGVPKSSQLDPSQFADFHAKATALLAN